MAVKCRVLIWELSLVLRASFSNSLWGTPSLSYVFLGAKFKDDQPILLVLSLEVACTFINMYFWYYDL
jgi:hypothetical protein